MEIKYLNDCLLIDGILIIGDVHIGYEEGIIRGGLLPRSQIKGILEKLKNVFQDLKKENIEIKKIVLLGDLKHDFGGVSDSEWRGVLELLNYLNEKCKDIVLIKGNHDNILEPIVRKKGIMLRDYYKIKIESDGKGNGGNQRRIEICFLHGHRLFKQCLNSDVLVIGHLHPAILIKDKYKKEKFKCFLCGNWKGKMVYILPSFSEINRGYNLRGLDYLMRKNNFSFIDVKTIKKLKVLIYSNKEGKVLDFGSVGRSI